MCVAGLWAALFTIAAGVARAEPPKLISYGNFPSSPWPSSVAVDQPGGDIFVANALSTAGGFKPGHIDKRDALGKLLAPPSPFGAGFRGGVAVNPTNGDLYAVNLFGTIETFDPRTGTQLSGFPVPLSGELASRLLQIATDSLGNVYLPVPGENKVVEYSSVGTLLNTFTASGTLTNPTGVAVDSSGNVWVADAGHNRIEELTPTDMPIAEIPTEGVESVALDTEGDVFATVQNNANQKCEALRPPCLHLVEYNSKGAQLFDIGAGSIGEAGSSPRRLPSQVAVNDSSGRVYVTDPLNERVWIFGPPTAPSVERELAAEVGASEAKLGALVKPGGIETSYRVEYGTTTAYGEITPYPEGDVGQGIAARTVWASASGLAPGTTYHYRVIATNQLGTTAGPDEIFTTETSEEALCPNEQFREGFSAGLPDCRAYELVTTPNKLSVQPDPFFFSGKGSTTAVTGGIFDNTAARDGNRMTYVATEGLPGATSGGPQYLATRGADGWSSENVLPLQSYSGDRCNLDDTSAQTFSPDLSQVVLMVGAGQRSGQANSQFAGGCNAEGLEVVSGEPLGVENLLLRDNVNGTYSLLNIAPPGVAPADAHFQGASANLRTVVFDEQAPLTSDAPAGEDDLYEWTSGSLKLVTVLPDGSPVAGTLARTRPGVISADGSHIFFDAGGNLYVRIDGERTEQLDVSQAGGAGGGGDFVGASSDGSQAFFTDEPSAALTNDTAPGSGTNLYRYANGQLTDLTPGGQADVQAVMGIGQDGSYVYFLALGDLAAGATQGQLNLYVNHAGVTTFITGLASGDGPNGDYMPAVSPNGAFIAFTSTKSLTGYENIDSVTGMPDSELFLYDAVSNRIECASCNPSGEAPSAGEASGAAIMFGPRYLSNSGRLFFQTLSGLLPRDTNGQTDVYEFESGQLHLISAGTSSSPSWFLDASESGDDVFFLTRQKLLAQDTNEGASSIYDARIDGGFPEVNSPPPCTTADACRAPALLQPSIYGAPSSQTFSGVGNVTPTSGAVAKKKTKHAQKTRCRKSRKRRRSGVCKARRKTHNKVKTKSHKGGK